VEQVKGRAVVKRLKPILVEAVAAAIWPAAAGRTTRPRARCARAAGRPAERAEAARADLHAGRQGRDGRARREHLVRGNRARIGTELAAKMRDISIRLYKEAADYAATRGIIIADTKFEFGLDETAR
jgi:phosphoribosylaminoimidazole-succinocarboxamide synthase